MNNALLRKIYNRIRRTPIKALGKAWRMARAAGIGGMIEALRTYTVINRQYQAWRQFQLESTAVDVTAFQPLISVMMPTYNTPQQWLRRAIESVLAQTYTHWELCIADDASTLPHIRSILEAYAVRDARIKIQIRATNGHISAASNTALSMASGEYVALLDHDDEISPDALLEVVKLLNHHRQADFVYSDEDKIEPDGTHTEPFFKPDWSPHLLLCCNYITHFAVIRRELVERSGGFRDEFVGSQDYDLFLRITDHTSRVFHIPKMLYSWRKIETSTASVIEAKSYATDAARRAVAETVTRRGLSAVVEPGHYFPFWRVRPLIKTRPAVAVIISLVGCPDIGAALRRVKKLRQKTIYQPYTVVLVAEGAYESLIRQHFARGDAQIVITPTPTSICDSLIHGADHTNSDYLVFLSPQAQPAMPDWMNALLEIAMQPDVGCAGGKLVSPRGKLLHAGITLGVGGAAGCAGQGIADVAHPIFYFNLKDAIREVSAVSSAAMMIAREHFTHAGGFDSAYQRGLFDVDLCLRLKRPAIYTPFARFILHGNLVTPNQQDERQFRQRWADAIPNDPYYNINLTRQHTDLSIHLPGN